MMKFSTHPLCHCTDPETGRRYGQACPKLGRKDGSWNSRHGSMGWAARIPVTGGIKQIKRYGYGSTKDAEADAGHAGKLLGLATDDITRARIGDLIASWSRSRPPPRGPCAARPVTRRSGRRLPRLR
jgi:hypothetical protein